MSNQSRYHHTRINLPRLFLGLAVVLCMLSSGRLETASPIAGAILFLAGCFLVAVASLGRMWCSLYIAGYKTSHLITSGPYSICRHPLYFFSFLGGIGIGLASETITIPAMITVMFLLYYPHVMRFEEAKLQGVHGRAWDTYCRRTPRFWPKWSLLTEPAECAVNPQLSEGPNS